MPFYPYECSGCSHRYEVTKSIREIDKDEECPRCKRGNDSSCRRIGRTHFYGAKVEDAEWNPGLGCVTYGAKDRAEKARRRGVIEVGNESAESMHQREDRMAEERDAHNYETDLKWVGEDHGSQHDA
jgi:putative FmdB family regulatory protein